MMLNLRQSLTLFFLCFSHDYFASAADGDPEKEISNILSSYNRNHIPHTNPEPPSLFVDVNFYIYGISSISVTNMDYSVELLLRQRWTDNRLKLTTLPESESLPITYLKGKIWIPDLFFRNAKKGSLHKITTSNYLLRITADGTITYSQKLSVQLSCHMDLWKFPFDKQICVIDFGSYGYAQKEIDFRWWNDPRPFSARDINHTVDEAVTFKPNLKLSEFDLISHSAKYCSSSFSLTGKFSCAIIQFHLRRQLGFYIIYGYIPSALVVSVGWFSFLISAGSVSARVSMSLISILTQVTMSAAVLRRLPPVSYLKAIDLWFFTCLLFGLAALLEFVIAHVTLNKQKAKEKREEELRKHHAEHSSSVHEAPIKPLRDPHLQPRPNKAAQLDRVCFALYPMAFLLFNCVYWVIYLGILWN